MRTALPAACCSSVNLKAVGAALPHRLRAIPRDCPLCNIRIHTQQTVCFASCNRGCVKGVLTVRLGWQLAKWGCHRCGDGALLFSASRGHAGLCNLFSLEAGNPGCNDCSPWLVGCPVHPGTLRHSFAPLIKPPTCPCLTAGDLECWRAATHESRAFINGCCFRIPTAVRRYNACVPPYCTPRGLKNAPAGRHRQLR